MANDITLHEVGGMKRSLLDIERDLANAERAEAQLLAKQDAGIIDPRAVYRPTPGCTRGCPLCDIKCAIIVGEIYDFREELARYFRTMGQVTACSGSEAVH